MSYLAIPELPFTLSLFAESRNSNFSKTRMLRFLQDTDEVTTLAAEPPPSFGVYEISVLLGLLFLILSLLSICICLCLEQRQRAKRKKNVQFKKEESLHARLQAKPSVFYIANESAPDEVIPQKVLVSVDFKAFNRLQRSQSSESIKSKSHKSLKAPKNLVIAPSDHSSSQEDFGLVQSEKHPNIFRTESVKSREKKIHKSFSFEKRSVKVEKGKTQSMDSKKWLSYLEKKALQEQVQRQAEKKEDLEVTDQKIEESGEDYGKTLRKRPASIFRPSREFLRKSFTDEELPEDLVLSTGSYEETDSINRKSLKRQDLDELI
eukprot:maker-scaffold_21-snap-gene-5.27-mRNA-1 protein AED:0.08 eAED:0.12 QI:0/0/0.33/0.66/0/0/3/81/319